MLRATERINGGVLWAKLHLLFWLSLVPFVTGWMGENHFTALPTAFYGVVLLMAALVWAILQGAIIHKQGADSLVRKAVENDLKGKLSAVIYLVAIAAAFWLPALSGGLYALVALIWLFPDRRFERVLKEAEKRN